MADYQTVTVDCSTTFLRREVYKRGQTVAGIGVVTLPSSVARNCFLRIGDDGQPIRLNLEGQPFILTPPKHVGVFMDNNIAVAGAVVELMISIDDGESS